MIRCICINSLALTIYFCVARVAPANLLFSCLILVRHKHANIANASTDVPQSGAKASASQPCASDTIEGPPHSIHSVKIKGHVDFFRDVEKAISSRLREIVKAEGGSNYSWVKQLWTRIVRRLLGIKPPTRRGGMRPRKNREWVIL